VQSIRIVGNAQPAGLQRFGISGQVADSRGLDPNGSAQTCSAPQGDRLAQSRNPFAAGQQLLGRKQFRWWWNNLHQAIYDNGDGTGWSAHGASTGWVPQSKPLIFAEYGFASVDRCTNQPNVFFSATSRESATPFWSLWQGSEGGGWSPKRDDVQDAFAVEDQARRRNIPNK
jgi:hypothetical protein